MRTRTSILGATAALAGLATALALSAATDCSSVDLSATIQLGMPGDLAGTCMVALDDVDGDSVPDLMVSSRSAAWVISSTTMSVINAIEAEQPSDGFGAALDCVEDLNDDGIREALVGAPSWGRGRGAAHIVSPTDGSTLRVHRGEEATGRFGTCVLAVGDIDDDGLSDYCISAPAEGPGALYLFSAKKGHILWEAFGETDSSEFGHSLLLIRDADYDGLPDLVVGAPGALGSAADSGRVGAVALLSSRDGRVLNRHKGKEKGGGFGKTLAYLGSGDFVVGAPGKQSAVYHLSLDDRLGFSIIRVYPEPGPRGGHGEFLACFDINSDGSRDIIIGAPSRVGSGKFAYGALRAYSAETGARLLELVSPESIPAFGSSALRLEANGGTFLYVGAPGRRLPPPPINGSLFRYRLAVDAAEE